jgi:hypothetical protein
MNNDRWTPNKQFENGRNFQKKQRTVSKFRLPECEAEAEQIVKRTSFNTKSIAFLYALFWLFAVPGMLGCLGGLAYLLYKQDIIVALMCFFVVFSPIFFLKGLACNTHKRLYVAHCMGLRGIKNALIIGWDGHQYIHNTTNPNNYFIQKYILKIYGNDD